MARISGRRADLTRVRDPEGIRNLLVEGPHIGSLRGIERMSSLESLLLEGVRSPELRYLRLLPRLEGLMVDCSGDDVDWQQLEHLVSLRWLHVYVTSQAASEQLAALEFGRLRRLENLKLLTTSPSVVIRLDWLASLSQLDSLMLDGFRVTDEDIQMLCERGAQLRSLNLDSALPHQSRRLYDCLPRSTVYLGPVKSPLGRIHEHHHAGVREFSLGIDMADVFGTETNLEAERLFITELRREQPDIARRVQFDTESSAVWVVSPERGDLERILALLQTVSERRRPQRP